MALNLPKFPWQRADEEYYDENSYESLDPLIEDSEDVVPPITHVGAWRLPKMIAAAAAVAAAAGLLWALLAFHRPPGEAATYVESVPHLRGKKVVMIGDSVMRYKYVNLIYFMHHGVAVSSVTNSTEPGTHNPVDEKTWDSWTEFYSAPFMEGTEECDCFRLPSNDLSTILENRHYVDEHYDMRYYQFGFDNGVCSFRGRNLPPVIGSDGTPDWCYNLSGFFNYLLDVIKPDVVMMNQGLHRPIDTRSATIINHFAPKFEKFLWFTTTQSIEKSISHDQDQPIIDGFTRPSTIIVDAWQISTDFQENYGTEGMYWDRLHFLPWVYDEMLRVALNTLRRR